MVDFKTPGDCAAARDIRAGSQRYGFRNNAKGETRQVQCELCSRWCYKADRCNLFKGLPQRRTRKSAQRTGVTHEKV